MTEEIDPRYFVDPNEVDDTAEDPKERYKEADFSYTYTNNIPELLKTLNISIAFTSYQAGRLMLVRSDGESLDVNFKSFQRPMGLTVSESGLTLGIFTQIVNFHREDGLLAQAKKPLESIDDDITAPRVKPKDQKEEEKLAAEKREAELTEEQKKAIDEEKKIQKKKLEPIDERADSLFIARSAHYSSMINIHDIEWGDEGLWAVNSSFSCLCTFDTDFSFVPRWKPHFIDELVPEDRCHLNGMTLKDGKPAYVTTFSTYNKKAQWRKGKKHNGTLMDVENNEILVDGLAMPHSPRWHNGKVYFCNSGLGEICSYDPETKTKEVLLELQGFTRGIDFYGPIMFVGLSEVRSGDVTEQAPLEKKYDETFSGLWLINLDDHSVIGHIKYTGNVDQIYDVAVLPGTSFPELIEPSHPRMRNHFCHSELVDI